MWISYPAPVAGGLKNHQLGGPMTAGGSLADMPELSVRPYPLIPSTQHAPEIPAAAATF